MNKTIMQFGYPDTVLREYDHWVVMIRRRQITIGSVILAAKGEKESLSDVSPEAFSELSIVTSELEKTLSRLFSYDKVNYLLLMMRDKYVHFHVIPRYSGARKVLDRSLLDEDWPMPPNVAGCLDLSENEFSHLYETIKDGWICA